MKSHFLVPPFILLLFFIFSFADQPVQAQNVWYVDAAATGSDNGQNWQNAFNRLDGVVRNASPGDQVWVRTGVYTNPDGGSGSAFTIGDGVEVYGGFNGTETELEQRDWEANPTVLTANYTNTPTDPNNAIEDASDPANLNGFYPRVVRFSTGNTNTAVLDGFIITGGNRGDGSGVYIPGGDPVFPVLRNLHIEGNRSHINSGYGGGMYAIGNNYPLLIENVTFKRNYAKIGGGYAQTLHTASIGPEFKNVQFIENHAFDDPEDEARILLGNGGGAVINGGDAIFEDVVFRDNSSEVKGGAAMVRDGALAESHVIFRNVEFTGNESLVGGGAVYLRGSGSAEVTNALFYDNYTDNHGSALLAEAAEVLSVTNATFSKNVASAPGTIYSSGTTVSVQNAILWDNEPSITIFAYGSGSVELSYSLYDGSLYSVSSGSGNLQNQNPVFVAPENNIYQIRDSSPARNSGDPATDHSIFPTDESDDPIDLTGSARVQEGQITMGAFETTIGDPPTAADIAIKNTAPLALATPISNVFVSPDNLNLEVIRIVSLPENGVLSFSNNTITTVPADVAASDFSSLEYQPDEEGAFGPLFDSFTFEINDGFQDGADTYTATLNIDEGPETYRSFSTRDGSGSRGAVIATDDEPHFDFESPFTIEFWVKADENQLFNPAVFSTIDGSAAGGFQLEVGVDLGGVNRIGLVGPGLDISSYFVVSDEITIPENEWFHVAFVNDGNTESDRKILINGEDVTANFVLPDYQVQNNLDDVLIGLGSTTNSDTQFSGNLANLRIWGEARTEQQINALRYEYLSGDEQNLLANYFAGKTGGGEAAAATLVGPDAQLTGEAAWDGDSYRPFGLILTGSEGWRMMSNPVEDAFYSTLLEPLWTQGFPGADSPGFGEPNVLVYDESNQLFTSIEDAYGEPDPARGFIVYVYDDQNFDDLPDGFPKEIQIDKTQNSGPVTSSLSFTDTEDLENDGWNLVGNPYGTTINWDSGSGWTTSNLDAAIYIWNADTGEYQSWNGVTGTLPDEGLIAPWQGFWVKANDDNPALIFTDEVRSTGGKFLKQNPVPQIIFELENKQYQSQTVVMFSDQASEGKDPLDAYKLQPLNTGYLSLHTLLDNGTALDINALPAELNEPLSIALDFDGSELHGEFMLSWNPEALPDGWLITVRDNETEKETDLRDQDTYSFNLTGGIEKQNVGNQTPGSLSNPIHEVLAPEAMSASAGKAGAETSRFTVTITPANAAPNDPELPDEFGLAQNYPNPFNPVTVIRYQLPASSDVQLEVFDMLGRRVATLVNGPVDAGTHEVNLDASHLSSGIYIYRLQAGNHVLTRKLTLIK